MDEAKPGHYEAAPKAAAASSLGPGSREASVGSAERSPERSSRAEASCEMPHTSTGVDKPAEMPPGDRQNGGAELQQQLTPPEPEPQATVERVCSNCHATSTPMWRNDSNGRKTLCNACGVRLSRQASKAKQEAAGANGEAPTSLIAGKQPRSRSSPAKRSASSTRHQDLGSPPPGLGLAPPGAHAPVVLLKRRRSDQLLSTAASPTAADFEPHMAQGGGDPEEFPIELIAHTPQGSRRISNVSVGLQLMNNEVGGDALLVVYHESGQIIANCPPPRILASPVYQASHQGWLWSSQTFSLLLKTETAFKRFKGLLKCWKGSSSSPEPETSSGPPTSMPSSASSGSLGRSSNRRADAEDLEFLRKLNQKIRDTQTEAAGNPADPKSVTHPLSVEVLMLMLDALQYAQSQSPGQTLSPHYVDVVCRNCSWAPNRVIGLVVYKYWLTRISRGRPHSAPLASSPSATLADSLLGMSFPGPSRQSSAVRQLSMDLSSSAGHQAPATPIRSSSGAALAMQFSAPPAGAAQPPDLMLGTFIAADAAATSVMDDCDPLDPANLARISDPHETRRSPGEDHSDQTTDLTDGHQGFSHTAGQFDLMMSETQAHPAEPAVLPEGRLGLQLRRGPLRRAMSFWDKPVAARTKSPGTPTSGGGGAASLATGGRHQSLPSLMITSAKSSPLLGVYNVEEEEPAVAGYDDSQYFTSIINQH